MPIEQSEASNNGSTEIWKLRGADRSTARRRRGVNSDVEFAIPTRSGGRWLGQLTADGAAIAVRTFVE
jgi:hypothetical protein